MRCINRGTRGNFGSRPLNKAMVAYCQSLESTKWRGSTPLTSKMKPFGFKTDRILSPILRNAE